MEVNSFVIFAILIKPTIGEVLGPYVNSHERKLNMVPYDIRLGDTGKQFEPYHGFGKKSNTSLYHCT